MIQTSYLVPPSPNIRTRITFKSEGLTLVGHWYRPKGVGSDIKTPAIAMAGPMTSVKEETLPHYAEALAANGYSVLAFDNRNFGESEGEVRQHLDTSEQVEDLKNALSYLRQRADVDSANVGLVCVCLGAGYALAVSAFDPDVKVVALVAGGYNIADSYYGFLGRAGFASYMRNLKEGRLKQYKTGEVGYMPAIEGPPNYAPAAMPVQEAWEFYSRSQSTVAPNWRNELTIASMESIVGWNVVGFAHLVQSPTLVVHGTTDFLLPPIYAEQVYNGIEAEKKVVWIETSNHVELYDQAPFVPLANEAVVAWVKAHMPN